MRFLRGEGPAINLDQVFDNVTSDDDSSLSSDATSALMEERAKFMAAQARCANVLVFGRKGLPSDRFIRGADLPAIRELVVVDRAQFRQPYLLQQLLLLCSRSYPGSPSVML